jgi:hypothetical protein
MSCGIEGSCTKSFPYPFTEFPIFIWNDNAEGSAAWNEIFPEAQVINDFNQLMVGIASDIGGRGALVIKASTYTPVCRDLFLNYVTAAIKISSIRSYGGFYIDNFYNPFPLTVEISDISPRQVFQLSSDIVLPLTQRSYWLSSLAAKSNCVKFEGQFYPALVVDVPPFPRQTTVNVWIFLVIGLLIFIGLFFWLACLLS